MAAVGVLGAAGAYEATPAEAQDSRVTYYPGCQQGNPNVIIHFAGPYDPNPEGAEVTFFWGSQTAKGVAAPQVAPSRDANTGVSKLPPNYPVGMEYSDGYVNDHSTVNFDKDCSNPTPDTTSPPNTQPHPTSPPQTVRPTTPTTAQDIGRGVSPDTAPPTSSNISPTSETAGTPETLASTTTATTEVSTTLKKVAKGLDSDHNSSDGKFAPGLALAGLGALTIGVFLRRRARQQAS